ECSDLGHNLNPSAGREAQGQVADGPSTNTLARYPRCAGGRPCPTIEKNEETSRVESRRDRDSNTSRRQRTKDPYGRRLFARGSPESSPVQGGRGVPDWRRERSGASVSGRRRDCCIGE